MNKQLTVHDLPVQERPRERLVAHGPRSLSVIELMAVVLGRGTSGDPVMAIAAEVLARFQSLNGLAEASFEDLLAIRGIGAAKACQLMAVCQLMVRMQGETTETLTTGHIIDQPQCVAELVRRSLLHRHREQYVIVSLDARRRFIGLDVVSVGILDSALVHPRETFEVAIKRHAASVILAHNHPSGSVEPSDDDMAITKRLVTAGKIMGIRVVDHIIVSDTDYMSFQQRQLL